MLQNIIDDMEGMEARLRSIVPLGYNLAVNIRYFTPEFLTSTYPEAWVEIYAVRRYALFDPVTLWCRFNEGASRWSDIEFGALQNVGKIVMDHAQTFGLKFGGAAAMRIERDVAVRASPKPNAHPSPSWCLVRTPSPRP